MVRDIAKNLANGAGQELAKRASVFLILAVMVITMYWLNSTSQREIAIMNAASMDRAVDRLVEMNNANMTMIVSNQQEILRNQGAIIQTLSESVSSNSERDKLLTDQRDLTRQQLDVAKETLTILKTKGP